MKKIIDGYMSSLINYNECIEIYMVIFEKAIKESAVDCTLNKNANVDANDNEDIICDK